MKNAYVYDVTHTIRVLVIADSEAEAAEAARLYYPDVKPAMDLVTDTTLVVAVRGKFGETVRQFPGNDGGPAS